MSGLVVGEGAVCPEGASRVGVGEGGIVMLTSGLTFNGDGEAVGDG